MISLKYIQAKLDRAGQAIVQAIAKFDPEGATEAQIREQADRVRELAQLASKAMVQAEASEKKAAEFNNEADRAIRAAGIIETQMTAQTGAALAQSEKTLNALVTRAQDFTVKADEAKAEAAEDRAYYEELKQTVEEEGAKLTKARSNLERLQRDQERAARDAERAAERRRDAERVAGLRSGGTGADVAGDAMRANIARMRESAQADRMTAGVLTGARDTDDAVAAALKAADTPAAAPGASASERLAALRASRGI